MNPRERRIVIVIGALLGAWAAYQGVTRLVLGPARQARADLVQLQNQYSKLKRERDLVSRLGREWKELTQRTYSLDELETQNAFGEELKRLAVAHNLGNARFTPRAGGKIPRSDIRTMSYLVVADGKLSDVVGFLKDFYSLPSLGRIRKLRLSPVKQSGGSDDVRIDELIIETLILAPTTDLVDRVKREVRNATTMPAEPENRLPPLRQVLPAEDDYRLLARHNLFKAYEPPPGFALSIDNQDLKEVEVRVKFGWKGDWTEQPAQAVPGKSKRDVTGGAGDVADVIAKYADGKVFGPQKLPNTTGKPVVFAVPSHTPPPPPSMFAYKVRNDCPDAVDVEIILIKGSQPKPWPMIRVPAQQTVDLPELTGDQLTLTGVFGDGSRAAPGVYQVATQSTGTYVIAPKQANAAPPTKPAVTLPPPSPDLQVTALVVYPQSEEMIAFNNKTKKREVMALGAVVDGGKLLGVISATGGVVKMPNDAYYLYPLGRRFADRVELLGVQCDEDVPSAVDDWSRQQ